MPLRAAESSILRRAKAGSASRGPDASSRRQRASQVAAPAARRGVGPQEPAAAQPRVRSSRAQQREAGPGPQDQTPAAAPAARAASAAGAARSVPHAAAADYLPRRPAGLRPARRHRQGDPGKPGDHRVGRDRLRQDHPAAEDLPRTRARPEGPDRPHPAAPDRRVVDRQADRAGTRLAAGRARRLQGALHRHLAAGRLGQADDRRYPAGRNPDRSAAEELRHDHHRRGARAQPEHRFPARLPQAAAAAPARPEGDHHLGDDRRRPLRAPFRQPATSWRR